MTAPLRGSRWRLWTGAVAGLALLLLSASHHFVGGHVFSGQYVLRLKMVELALATCVLFGCGGPLLASAWRTLRASGMDRIVLLCAVALVAYVYGVLAVAVPELFPVALKRVATGVNPHFEVGAILVVLALFLRFRRDTRPAAAGDVAHGKVQVSQ